MKAIAWVVASVTNDARISDAAARLQKMPASVRIVEGEDRSSRPGRFRTSEARQKMAESMRRMRAQRKLLAAL